MRKFFQWKKKPDGFTCKFYEPVRELLTYALLKLLQNSRLDENPTNTGYKVTITVIPTPRKHRERKLETNITQMNRDKHP